QLAAQYPDKLAVLHTLTREPNASAVGASIRSGRISEDLLKELIPAPANAHVYCCGPGITKFDREKAKAAGFEPAPRFLESALAAPAPLAIPPQQIHR